jgi:hypothetical protein
VADPGAIATARGGGTSHDRASASAAASPSGIGSDRAEADSSGGGGRGRTARRRHSFAKRWRSRSGPPMQGAHPSSQRGARIPSLRRPARDRRRAAPVRRLFSGRAHAQHAPRTPSAAVLHPPPRRRPRTPRRPLPHPQSTLSAKENLVRGFGARGRNSGRDRRAPGLHCAAANLLSRAFLFRPRARALLHDHCTRPLPCPRVAHPVRACLSDRQARRRPAQDARRAPHDARSNPSRARTVT